MNLSPNPLDFIPLPYKILGIFLICLALVGGGFAGGFAGGYLVRDTACKAAALELALQTEKDTNKLKLDLASIGSNTTREYNDRVVPIYIERERNTQLAGQVADKASVSKGWVYLHDTAALGGTAQDSLVVDGDPSDTPSNDALSVVTDNYGTCRAIRQQLIALQSFNAQVAAATTKGSKPKSKGSDVP